MAELDLDALFAVAEAGPLLDKVAQQVKPATAAGLQKLQEDVGLEIDNEMTGAPLTGPGDGPESARLRAAYEPVTPARLGVLNEASAALPAGALKESLSEIIGKLPVPSASTRVTAPGSAP